MFRIARWPARARGRLCHRCPFNAASIRSDLPAASLALMSSPRWMCNRTAVWAPESTASFKSGFNMDCSPPQCMTLRSRHGDPWHLKSRCRRLGLCVSNQMQFAIRLQTFYARSVEARCREIPSDIPRRFEEEVAVSHTMRTASFPAH